MHLKIWRTKGKTSIRTIVIPRLLKNCRVILSSRGENFSRPLWKRFLLAAFWDKFNIWPWPQFPISDFQFPWKSIFSFLEHQRRRNISETNSFRFSWFLKEKKTFVKFYSITNPWELKCTLYAEGNQPKWSYPIISHAYENRPCIF